MLKCPHINGVTHMCTPVMEFGSAPTPPKATAAILEAMLEVTVTRVAGNPFRDCFATNLPNGRARMGREGCQASR